jgi:hypothetical protein
LNKTLCLICLIVFLASGLSAADYSFKFFTPDDYDVAIEIPAAMKADSDAKAADSIEGLLASGKLTMDVGRVGSNFNVNYTMAFRNMVEKNGDEAKTRGIFQIMNESGRVVGEWELDLCWPSKITGPAIKTDVEKNTISTVEISFNKATRIK